MNHLKQQLKANQNMVSTDLNLMVERCLYDGEVCFHDKEADVNTFMNGPRWVLAFYNELRTAWKLGGQALYRLGDPGVRLLIPDMTAADCGTYYAVRT